jgi:membrane protein YdbS with pleckstrin-like domain
VQPLESQPPVAEPPAAAPPGGAAPPAEPSVADGLEHALHPSWVELQRLVGWIVWAVIVPSALIAVLIVLIVPSVPTGVKILAPFTWLAAALLLAWLAQKWPPIEYRYFRYRLDAQGVEIRTGVVWRRVISVPRSRVQHIDVAQGPVERRYGLATLSIYTAGTEFAKVDLPGIEYHRAVRIRDHLLPGREHGVDDGT